MTLVLRSAAFRALGWSFTFHVETWPEQPVISTGPYRMLRHPGYSAVWLILVGLALMCGTWIALVASVVLPAIGFASMSKSGRWSPILARPMSCSPSRGNA